MTEKDKYLISKIDELATISAGMGDKNIQIVLSILSGAKGMGHDGLLATHLQEYTKEVLMPRAEREMELRKANEN